MVLPKIVACYINLDRRTDKNNDALNNIKKLGFDNITRFSAIDGKNLVTDLQNKNYYNNPIIQNLKINNNCKKNNACELACSLSHYFLLNQILEDENIKDDDIVFMFEDDFFINEKYLEDNGGLNEIIKDLDKFNWDLIYFGGRFNVNFIPTNLTKYFKQIYNNFYKKTNSNGNHDTDRTTHNYVIKKSNVKKICDLIYNNFVGKNPIITIDTLLNGLTQELIICDFFPHIFYSPIDYKTDIQHTHIYVSL